MVLQANKQIKIFLLLMFSVTFDDCEHKDFNLLVHKTAIFMTSSFSSILKREHKIPASCVDGKSATKEMKYKYRVCFPCFFLNLFPVYMRLCYFRYLRNGENIFAKKKVKIRLIAFTGYLRLFYIMKVSTYVDIASIFLRVCMNVCESLALLFVSVCGTL